jgi:ATP-binding cassette subfamily F protein 3
VLVSHDRRLVERVATEVLLLEGEAGFHLNRVEEAFARLGLAPAPRAKDTDAERAPRRSALEEERRRLRRDSARAREHANDLARQVEQAEARLSEIEELLCRREVYSDLERARELGEEAAALREGRDGLSDDWVAAEEDAEALARRLAELEQQRGEP